MSADAWLREYTHRSAGWWVAAVQKAFGDASSPSDDPDHDNTDTKTALTTIVSLVSTVLSKEPDERYDPNIRAACVLAVVSALWAARVRYAKIHDPARPISSRQKAYESFLSWVHALFDVVINESEDTAYFPGQKWDHPFAYDATDGDFV